MRSIDGWVAYLDAYGFGAAITDQEHIDGLFADLNDCLQRNSRRLAAGFQFSDSIFLLADTARDATQNLISLIDVVREMQRAALRHGFAFRGAFSFGEKIKFGAKGFYGNPIVRAVRFEESLASPLIVIPESDIVSSQTALHLPLSIVDTKRGQRRMHIVRSHRYLFSLVAQENASKALADGPDDVAVAWLRAIDSMNATSLENDE